MGELNLKSNIICTKQYKPVNIIRIFNSVFILINPFVQKKCTYHSIVEEKCRSPSREMHSDSKLTGTLDNTSSPSSVMVITSSCTSTFCSVINLSTLTKVFIIMMDIDIASPISLPSIIKIKSKYAY